ncbi:hypothetical protein NQZ68_002977 [Dissostichus eleginoides]|nr:hypothetical protein NQZ68_002977 [Dissostichus eleginoides]
MPLYLGRPGGKMKGMSVLRTLGKRLAQPPVSKPRGGHQAAKHTAQTTSGVSTNPPQAKPQCKVCSLKDSGDKHVALSLAVLWKGNERGAVSSSSRQEPLFCCALPWLASHPDGRNFYGEGPPNYQREPCSAVGMKMRPRFPRKDTECKGFTNSLPHSVNLCTRRAAPAGLQAGLRVLRMAGLRWKNNKDVFESSGRLG